MLYYVDICFDLLLFVLLFYLSISYIFLVFSNVLKYLVNFVFVTIFIQEVTEGINLM